MKYRQGFFLFFQRIQKNYNSLISLKPFSHIDVKDDIISLWKRVLYILSVCHSLKIKRILSYSFHIKQWDNKNWQITVNMRVKERRERERVLVWFVSNALTWAETAGQWLEFCASHFIRSDHNSCNYFNSSDWTIIYTKPATTYLP